MTALRILKAGPATSVQDGGRRGWQRFGLATSGAVDVLALAIANTLVGQPTAAAALEIGPSAFEAEIVAGEARVAVSGAVRTIKVAGRTVPAATTAIAAKGDTIELSSASDGVFSYIAVEGGIVGTPQLGSMAVHQRGGLGVPFARPLRGGDSLDVGAAGSRDCEQELPCPPLDDAPGIRVILGPQDDYFSRATILRFLTSEWRVSAASDRMGYRLIGEPLDHAKGFNIISDGTVTGSIQVPGNGIPLVLLPDRGTVGGYPKIAVIATADLARFAQTPAGGSVVFRAVDIGEAQAAARRLARTIASLGERVRPLPRAAQLVLAGVNLAGNGVSALDAGTWTEVCPSQDDPPSLTARSADNAMKNRGEAHAR